MASDAAKAEARAAVAALRAVEAGIAVYAERRDYLKLKDIAEASDVAGKVCRAEREQNIPSDTSIAMRVLHHSPE